MDPLTIFNLGQDFAYTTPHTNAPPVNKVTPHFYTFSTTPASHLSPKRVRVTRKEILAHPHPGIKCGLVFSQFLWSQGAGSYL